jgi:autotransporter-associated beta strand protein
MLLRRDTGNRLTSYVPPAAALVATFFLAGVARADNPKTSWTGANTGPTLNSFNWSDTGNWTNGLPDSTKEVWFDQNSRPVDNPVNGDMTINDLLLGAVNGDFNGDHIVDAGDYVWLRKTYGDITSGTGLTAYNTWRANFGLTAIPILGIVNTSSSQGPTGNLSISGNPLSIGSIGIRFGGSAFAAPYNGAAMKPLAINTDITLAADQPWQTGGTFGTINPNDIDPSKARQSLTIGQSRDVHVNTLDTNGHVTTIKTIGSAHTIVINSDVIGTGALGFDKGTAGSANAVSAVRILGTNTYSGDTNILGSREIIQLGTSTVKNGQGQIISGPLGTGRIISTENPNCGTGICSSQFPAYQPWGADRTLDNDITMRGIFLVSQVNDTAGITPHTLTFNGTITVPESVGFGGTSGSGPPNASRILVNNGPNTLATTNNTRGSGDVAVNGDVLLSNPGGGYFGAGHGGATSASAVVSGKITFNGNIVKSIGAGSYEFHVEGYSTNTELNPARVRFNGQNAFDTAFLITKTCVGCGLTEANIQLGSSTTPDGLGGIASGPLGKGLVSIGGLPLDNYGNPGVTRQAVQASFEAVGGARTVANNISLVNNAANSQSSALIVQGSQDLTLSGVISSEGAVTGTFAGGSLTKDGTANLTLTGANTYTGDTKVLGGTLAIGTVGSPATPWLADGADVYLTSTGAGLALNFPTTGTTDTIRSLYIDGVLQAAGTWGNSGAQHPTSLITGNGWLNVITGSGSGGSLGAGAVPEPACLALLMSGLGAMLMTRRR